MHFPSTSTHSVNIMLSYVEATQLLQVTWLRLGGNRLSGTLPSSWANLSKASHAAKLLSLKTELSSGMPCIAVDSTKTGWLQPTLTLLTCLC